ncbi:MAG: radical SAM protein [Elusimicrobiales bacterium]|nr:radical SAM protein [Elusimicrobiales bacterium]
MRILLINLPRVDGFPVIREERFEHKDFEMVQPPLGLLYCASMLRAAGHAVALIDANALDLSQAETERRAAAFAPGIIIARVAFDAQDQDAAALARIKAAVPGALVLTRNKILSDVPALRDAFMARHPQLDYFLLMEPESVVGQVCAALAAGQRPPAAAWLEKGAVTEGAPAQLPAALDEFPFPAYDLLETMAPYKTSMFGPVYTLVLSSRGCPFQCTFCAYCRSKYRERSAANVVAELKWLKETVGLKNFVFFDDTISLKRERTMEIFRLMRESALDLKFGVCTRVDLIDDEMVAAARAAGCVEIGFGVESGSQKVLDLAKKGIKLDQVRAAFALCKKHGIKSIASVILGLPGETEETVRETFRFISELNPYYCQYAIAVPFPNTEVYRYYDERGLILTRDWTKYNPLEVSPVFRTEALSAERLTELKRQGYIKFLLRPSFILSKIEPFNLLWNIKGFFMYAHRLAGLLLSGRKYVR